MIYSQTHGSPAYRASNSKFNFDNMVGTFRYLFFDAPLTNHNADSVARLDDLAAQMVDPRNAPNDQNSLIPPVFTYFGQFIDHDITAGTDSDPKMFSTVDDTLTPIKRDLVQDLVRNQRTAMLDLDSVYGGDVTPGSFDEKLKGLMRHPKFPGKMLIAFPKTVPGTTISPPVDGATDQLRLGRYLDGKLTESELRNLSDTALQKMFFFVEPDPADPTDPEKFVLGSPNRHRALLGDARNDENLFVSQFHLAIIRFHNNMVDACDDEDVIRAGGDSLFKWAMQRVRWVYQWLVVNEYLKTVCDASVLSTILSNEAPIYNNFLTKAEKLKGRKLPMPFEFSAAAFRFGHSMVRQNYDWNEEFENAPFSLFFLFTGSVKNPMGGFTDAKLPSNWPADWSRTARLTSGKPNRSARQIDTNLSFELGQLPPQADGTAIRPIPNLAKANLRKGHLLNLPSAQSCLDGIETSTGIKLDRLTYSQLTQGATGEALKAGGFVNETPIWFYILKEAEILNDGNRLGPLGTALIADTIIGLLINDPDSYWNQNGSDANGRWHPSDTVKVSGVEVNSIESLLRAAQVL